MMMLGDAAHGSRARAPCPASVHSPASIFAAVSPTRSHRQAGGSRRGEGRGRCDARVCSERHSARDHSSQSVACIRRPPPSSNLVRHPRFLQHHPPQAAPTARSPGHHIRRAPGPSVAVTVAVTVGRPHPDKNLLWHCVRVAAGLQCLFHDGPGRAGPGARRRRAPARSASCQPGQTRSD
ncbi:hypothetical protein DAEQUDRAFT_324910 [Daedalea quercina L-15889]|uniref:Uncharacterized protein n=1 Tax=Daedalea quercina L-15889 TaxID=1314783 RepID=A0A165PU85_9APHY|nr:hypothetical protein DAEQUDRAFT_324910 [Daedalea quercina L-15889]